MSNFLDELRDAVLDSANTTEELDKLRHLLSHIDSLGTNARRMLEIGILQDELAKLNFRQYSLSGFTFKDGQIVIKFCSQWCRIGDNDFYYHSPTWQQDVLNKVKELINE